MTENQAPERNRISSLLIAGAVATLLAVAVVFYLRATAVSLDSIAEDYVQLALALDQLSEGEVDSYFGPDGLSARNVASLDELEAQIELLQVTLEGLENPEPQRYELLQSRIQELLTITAYLQNPDAMSFVEQSAGLFGLTLAELPAETELNEDGRVVYVERPPTPAELRQQEIIDQLTVLLPGRGSLPFRVASFQSQLLVPLDRREQVFERAMQACREVTLEHWDLPEDEVLLIEWTREVSTPWHRYQGNGTSSLQINPLSIGYIGTMVDVACHEGYPGHHAQYLSMDSRDGGYGNLPLEDQLLLLRTPLAVLLEGAADFGVDLAFPAEDRLVLDRDVLFPLAGLDPDLAEQYVTVHQLLKELAVSSIPTLQAYGDKQLPRAAAAVRLEAESLVSGPMALLDFVEQYGAYSVGYTLAEQQLDSYMREQASNPGQAWDLLGSFLKNPQSRTGAILAP